MERGGAGLGQRCISGQGTDQAQKDNVHESPSPPPITRPSLLTGDITTHVDGHHNSQSASQKHGEEVAFGFLTSDSLGHSPLGDELVGEER